MTIKTMGRDDVFSIEFVQERHMVLSQNIADGPNLVEP